MSVAVAEKPATILDFPFATDGGVAPRAAIGLVVLATDQTIEHEFRQVIDLPGVGFYESRIFNANEITPETLRAMEKDIASATGLILPGQRLDVVGFGCTSASMLLGEETIGRHIRTARPGVAYTTPVTGVFAGLRALGAKKIGVLTPYTDEVNAGIRSYVEGAGGFDVAVMGSFKEINDSIVARISPASSAAAGEALSASTPLDAVFISCTSLRVVSYVAELEARIGIPVTSSNHALAWHSLRLAGVDDKLPKFGRLFTQA